MRTTLSIDDDLLVAAKEPARREGTTTGRLVPDLVREALRARAVPADAGAERRDLFAFRTIPAGGAVVTNALVDELRDELGV